MNPEPTQRGADHLAALLEDLEQQAAGLHSGERNAEVSSLATAHYSEVDFASRLHAHVGGELSVRIVGQGQVRGRLSAVGADYLQMLGQSQTWLVLLDAVAAVQGIGAWAQPAEARGMRSRLSIGSVMRSAAEENREVTLMTRDAEVCQLVVWRVGADFVEGFAGGGDARRAPEDLVLVPWSAVAAVTL